jgi:hypothetical protein
VTPVIIFAGLAGAIVCFVLCAAIVAHGIYSIVA